MNYQTFARIYDSVMDETLYDLWFDFTKRNGGNNPQTILELACGTGDLALRFAKNGYQVTGLDLSEEMLAMAFDRSIEENVAVNFLQGDMRDLSDIGTFDLVTCYSDSLCYLENPQDLKQTFASVYNVLNAGGRFLFDVHSIYQVTEKFKDYSFHEQGEDFAFLWDSFQGEVPNSVEHELTFFVEEAPEVFRRYDELHKERTYPLEDFKKYLAEVGFSKVKVCGDFTDDTPQAETLRWFFIAEK